MCLAVSALVVKAVNSQQHILIEAHLVNLEGDQQVDLLLTEDLLRVKPNGNKQSLLFDLETARIELQSPLVELQRAFQIALFLSEGSTQEVIDGIGVGVTVTGFWGRARHSKARRAGAKQQARQANGGSKQRTGDHLTRSEAEICSSSSSTGSLSPAGK